MLRRLLEEKRFALVIGENGNLRFKVDGVGHSLTDVKFYCVTCFDLNFLLCDMFCFYVNFTGRNIARVGEETVFGEG